ncbi:MAG: hypothetical protein ACI828_001034 [Flavobacteriales bacterium]|jgi:hypothetical protein
MKIFFAVLFTLLFTQESIAQTGDWLTRSRVQKMQNLDKQVLSWGYYFGINSFDFNFDYREDRPDIQVERETGFTVGMVGDLRISEHINLRLEPGLVYAQRNLIYPDDPAFTTEEDQLREVGSTYIYIPLLLRFSTKRLNNIKPFVTFGVATAYNLSSNERNPDDNGDGQFRTTTRPFFYDIGFGIDLFLDRFKLTPSIRGVFAVSDELVQDDDPNSPWTSNITRMSTRGIFLNFTFR